MLQPRRRGAWAMAIALAATAGLLLWCAFHLHYDVLRSQQACDTTYMYPLYKRVDMPTDILDKDVAITGNSLAADGYAHDPQYRRHQQEQQSTQVELPPWAQDVAEAAGRLKAAAGALSQVQYGLWRYIEDDKTSPGSQGASGGSARLALPVLFIPGHGGSHEMARSLASETARQLSRQLAASPLGPATAASAAASLDWFLLGLEGEWSAFEGATLEAQVRFTLAAMRYIARTYNITTAGESNSNSISSSSNSISISSSNAAAVAPRPPRARQLHPGMLVVGHSMGGVVAADAVARAATDPHLGPSLVALLLTLGSPHTRPVLPGHPSLRDFYTRAAARPRPVVPVVALAGGLADVQVATALTDPSALAPEGFTRSLALPQLPGGWCPAGHSALTSCNQAMLPLGRALVELAQDAVPSLLAARKQVTSPPPKAAATATPSPATPDSPSIAADPAALMREAHRPDSYGSDGSGGMSGGGNGSLLPWDWALRRVERRLSHPAQGYLAAAILATAAAPGAEPTGEVKAEAAEARTQEDVGKGHQEEPLLWRHAQTALAPAGASGSGGGGGAGCSGGANLAWYLQYDKPLQVKSYGRKRGSNRAATVVRLAQDDMEGVPSTGRLLEWQLASSSRSRRAAEGASGGGGSGGGGGGGLQPQGWVAVVSGAMPCSAFRVWLSVTVEQQQKQSGTGATAEVAGAHEESDAVGGDGGGSGGGGSMEGREKLAELAAEARRSLAAPGRTVRHDVEVTGLAAPLPPVVREGRWPVRVRSDWAEVMRGRDYQSRAAWMLLLPPSLVLPLMQRAGVLPSDLAGGGGGSGGDRTVTVTLTLWLGEPSYKPAFRVVAAPLLLPRMPKSSEPRSPPPPLTPFHPLTLPDQQHLPLLLPLHLPYLTSGTGNSSSGRGDGFVRNVVRWLGLYRYAAVRIVALDRMNEDTAAGAAASSNATTAASVATETGPSERCLYPVVVLVGAVGGGRGRSEGEGGGEGGVRAARLVQVSSNLTFHSLEPCTTDPWGCAAVSAVLDPSCSYHIELVPYASQRLPALLLAQLGRLWLGAQLAALLGVLAAALAAANCTATAVMPSPLPAAKASAKASGCGSTAVVRQEPYGGQRRGALLFLRRFVAMPSEGFRVLQAGSQYWAPLTAFLVVGVISAALLSGGAWMLPPGTRAAEEMAHWGMDAGTASMHGNSSEIALLPASARLLGMLASAASGTSRTPAVQRLVRLLGLCPQPHLPHCGWETALAPVSDVLAAAAASAAGLTLSEPSLPSSSAVTAAAAAAAPAADTLCVLDWLVLAATALLVAWQLTAALTAAAAVTALAEATVRQTLRLLFVLPLRVLLLPLFSAVGYIRHRFLLQPRPLVDDAAVAVSNAANIDQTRKVTGLAAAAADAVSTRRWQVLRLLAAAALMVLAGAPYDIPAAILLTSALSLAMALMSSSPQSALSAEAEQTREEQRCGRRRHLVMAWLLYYSVYGSCAAPAVIAVLRRLVVRRAAALELLAACGEVAMKVWTLVVAEGRGVEGLRLGLQLLISAASSFAPLLPWAVVREVLAATSSGSSGDSSGTAISCGQLAYFLSAVHCTVLAWRAAAAPAHPEGAADCSGASEAAGPTCDATSCGLQTLTSSARASSAVASEVSSAGTAGGRLGAAAIGVGCAILGLAWWLGAPDAAHVTAGVSAAMWLALELASRTAVEGP